MFQKKPNHLFSICMLVVSVSLLFLLTNSPIVVRAQLPLTPSGYPGATYWNLNQFAPYSPYVNPYQTPYMTPYQTPYMNPYQTPYMTPYQTPYMNPYQTPYMNPYQTPYMNPYQTSYMNPYQTSYMNPYQYPYQYQYQYPYQYQYQYPYQYQYQYPYQYQSQYPYQYQYQYPYQYQYQYPYQYQQYYPQTTDVSLTATADGTSITVDVGDTIGIILQSNPSTGYQWVLDTDELDTDIVSRVSNQYYSNYGATLGASGYEQWIFEAEDAGTTTIKLEYRRTFETSILDTFEVDVEVE